VHLPNGVSFRRLTAPTLFMLAEFPRTLFAGNSSHCIKTEATEGHDYYRSLSVLILASVWASQLKRSILKSLGLAAACNAGRILMQNPA